jgi:hypothetical protein
LFLLVPPLQHLDERTAPERTSPGGFFCAAESRPYSGGRFVSVSCTKSRRRVGGRAPSLRRWQIPRQSQRDCVHQPKVARNELPWVIVNRFPNRNAVVAIHPRRADVSQGGSFLATLGFATESRWDSRPPGVSGVTPELVLRERLGVMQPHHQRGVNPKTVEPMQQGAEPIPLQAFA